MKSGYYLSADLISKRKFTSDDLERITSEMELNEDFFDLCSVLSGFISMNFSSHVEIYAEDIKFDSDKVTEVEQFIEIIDSLIPGGWGNDSKIEWTSDYPEMTYLWFKNSDVWESVTKDHDRGIWREEEEWDKDDSDYGYPDYTDPEDNW